MLLCVFLQKMCSLVDGAMLPVEDDDSSSVGSASTATTDATICKKCRVADSQLTLRKKDNYCSECFLAASKHKFRATLGKHKIMKLDERVLVSFQGNVISRLGNLSALDSS